MSLLQIRKPAKELVIICVADQRVVEDVILEIMFLDLLTQLEDFLLDRAAGLFPFDFNGGHG
jgi:hypothetical protein